MTMNAKWFCCFLWISLSLLVMCYAASFYGTSYVHLPLEDISSENEITLRFRTSRTRGLLFMAAGEMDYCIIQIESGRIHVLIEVGSGEIHMTLDQKIKFNDQEWHDISLQQLERTVTLFVDQKFSKTMNLLGDQYVLDVTDGIYVGSTTTDFNLEYASKVEKSFRGCIENVMFNNIDVFELSLETDDATSNDITQKCSAQFAAAPNDPISFVSDTSYLQMPRWAIITRGSFACWLKTSVGNGLILYQGGHTGDFIAAELTDSKVRTVFDRGSGILEFTSSIKVDDAHWHYLIIQFTDTSVSIIVDYEAEVQEIETDSEIFDMNGMMFVGGVVLKPRLDALQSDIHSITHPSSGGSFQGCIRDIEVNNQQLTLADTRTTHVVEMGCIYKFPCSDQPCTENEICTDVGTESHECHCMAHGCSEGLATTVDPSLHFIHSTKAITTLSPDDLINEPVTTKPVTLLEGGRVTITSNNIHLNTDISAYGLRPSQILFRQQKPPKHGGLYRYVLRNEDKTDQFTLLDLSGTSKITYQHDGSEHFKDKIRLELEVLGKNTLPEHFENVEFIVDVKIIPVNDPPKLVIPSDNILKIIRKSSIELSSNELHAMDPDTDPHNLTYSVLDSRKIGYISVDNLRTNEFTQGDINEKRVFFVHTGPTNKSRVTLRVSDGYKYSRPVPLRIEAIPLLLSVVHSSRLRVNPLNSVIIKTENLNVRTNAVKQQDLDISYEILANPRYGEIQKTTNGKHWKTVSSFQQRHIDKQKVRYLLNNFNTEADRKSDTFSVRATCLDQKSEDIKLLVDILITEIRILNNTGLTLNRQRRGLITSGHLSAVIVDPLYPTTVSYIVLRSPLKGDLLKNREKIMKNQNFTQKDVNDGIIEYRINDEVAQTINDSFLFQAFVVNAQSSHLKFDIAFVSEAGPVNLTSIGISVPEGGSHDITANELYASVEKNEDFEFTLTSFLQHGSLHLIDPTTSEIISANISSFFNSDLKDGAVRYQHDHSEGFTDCFGFIASTSFVDQAGILHEVQQPGFFNITVNLINDHKPTQVVLKPFQVVRNGKKLLTNRDLKFIDEDIDFDNGDIEYRRQRIRNGQFVWANDVETPVFRFYQRDIDDEKLLFKHDGVDEARMLLIVKDQDQSRFTTSYLKVVASDPFLSVITDLDLPVKLGNTATITGSYFKLETNMNIKDKNIVVDIVKPPVLGRILKVGSPVTSFTFEDLHLEKIEYECTLQNPQKDLQDSFDFVVISKELVTDGSLGVSIYLDVHQVLPEVFNNKPFFVEQGKAVVLSKSNLRVQHKNTLPGDIIFIVHQLPKYGILRINSDRNKRNKRQAELTFTQHDVNQGHVEYVQTTDADESQDAFTYDVDNGQSMLYNLTFIIQIAPEIVPLNTKNITLKEGSSRALTEDFISISYPYYEADDYTIQLITSPSHGFLDHSRVAGVPISQFTKEDIRDEFVYYNHDGSNTLLDSFSFIANFTDIRKVSDTCTVFVDITAVDDHEPEIQVNDGLQIIIGSTSVLSGTVLKTVDEDSRPDQLVYTLTTPNNGYLIVNRGTNEPILTFTQKDLDDENVMFVHSGAPAGGFRFQVSDGTHSSKSQIFSITAKALRISLTTTEPFIASSFALTTITTDNLMVEANHDLKNLQNLVTYIIIQAPKEGKLVKTSTNVGIHSSSTVNQFTQDDVMKGIIGYVHTSTDKSTTMDSFIFDVFVPFSQNLSTQLFNITIKPLDADHSMKVYNRGLNVTEGSEEMIGVQNLQTDKLFTLPSPDGEEGSLDIIYIITKLPDHGIIKLKDIAMKINETFTNQNIMKNQLVYVHDDSDTENDFMVVMISIVDTQKEVLFTKTELFNITVFPVNDETFEIVTKQLLIEVPQGAEYVVTKNDLQTIDPDTGPDQIVYDLLTSSNNGYLVLKTNKLLPITSFTQEDINSHKLVFIHDGTTSPGAFSFEVSDGVHQSVFKLLSIRIIPTAVEVTPGEDINLVQGMSEILLSRSNLNATTNGNILHLSYNITELPNFGHFVMQGEIVTQFLQEDVDMKLVKYIQTDLSVSSDSFSYVAFIDGTRSDEHSLNVTVLPSFVLKGFSVSVDSIFQLSSDYINATSLQDMTKSELNINVEDEPKFGSIVNVSSLNELSEFTYTDLLEGWIAFKVNHIDIQFNETLTNSYSLMISSSKVQPVLVVGYITILPLESPSTTETPGTTSLDYGSGSVGIFEPDSISDFNNSIDKDFETEEPVTTSPVYNEGKSDNIPPDTSTIPIIIPIIVVIIVLIIIILLVVLLIRKKRKADKSGRESPYPDMDGGPYPGASAIPGRAGILPPINICSVNYNSNTASQEFPYNGSGSLHRPVASPLVPQVTVTALGRPPSPSTIKKSSLISINSNATGSLSYSLSHDSHHGMPTPKLKKSQYWV